jgi:syntaxin-binding protein 5
MFLSHKHAVHMDLSTELRDSDDWKVGNLRSFEYPLNITTFAIESISCLLAVGTMTFSVTMALFEIETQVQLVV